MWARPSLALALVCAACAFACGCGHGSAGAGLTTPGDASTIVDQLDSGDASALADVGDSGAVAPSDSSAAIPDAADATPVATDALADAATADAALADAASDSAAADTLDATDTANPNSADAGQLSSPATCFYDVPPAADANVADVPAPAAPCADAEPPPWFAGPTVPKPTLNLQIGWRDATGTYHPYQNGDWVPMMTAMQGGFHLDLIPQVVLPGQTLAVVPLQVQSLAKFECNAIANANASQKKFIQDVGPDGLYTLPSGSVLTIFGASVAVIQQYCGIWIHVWWRVRVPDTDQWGEVVRVLRTYDATGIVPQKPGG